MIIQQFYKNVEQQPENRAGRHGLNIKSQIFLKNRIPDLKTVFPFNKMKMQILLKCNYRILRTKRRTGFKGVASLTGFISALNQYKRHIVL